MSTATPASTQRSPLSPRHKRSFSTRHTSGSSRSHSRTNPHLQHMATTQPPPSTVASAASLPPRRQSYLGGVNGNNNQRRGSTTGGPMTLGLNSTNHHAHNASSISPARHHPHHHANKATYFFPELSQGCLFFRDFAPAMIEKGGTFSSPQYEPFSKLVERANQWVLSCDMPVQIVKAECVTTRAEHNNADAVDTRASFHPDYVDWGMYLLSLRLWCRQAASPSLEAGGLGSGGGGVGESNDMASSTSTTGTKVSPLLSTRCMSLDVENYQPLSKQMYLSPNTSSPRLSPLMSAADGDETSINAGGTATVVGSTSNITTNNNGDTRQQQHQRSSPRPASSTSSSRTSGDPTTPPVFTGRLAYLDVLPDLLHAGVRTIEYERLSALVAKLNQKISDKRASNILTVQTVALRLHSNDTPDTECTCFSLHGHKQKCRLLFLRLFYFIPKLYSTPPSRTSPREPTVNAGDGLPKSPTEQPTTSSTTNSAASSRRSSLSRDAHQHQKLLSQLVENQHRQSLSGSSPSSRRGSGAYKEEIGLADFVPQIVRTNAYGKQGIEGMTSLARRAGEWFKRYREEHTDIRLVNFQTVTYYVRDWKHVDTERTFLMVHGDSDTFQYEHRALRIFYSRYVECVPYLPPFPLIDLKTFAPRQLNRANELGDTRFESTVQTASQIDQWLSESGSTKKLLDIETYDVTYCGVQDTAKAIEVPYLYAENRDKYVLTCFFLYYTDDETAAARKEAMELSPWHINGGTSSMGGSRRHSIATINLRNKVAREDENPDGCSLM